MGLWRVLSDLEEDGYRTEWGLFSAEETGAPHQRIRCFILAHTASAGKHGELRDFKQEKSRSNEYDCNGETTWPARPGEEQYEWEEPRVTEAQSELGGATHGTQHRVDRLRLLGNGVVPQTAELAWRTLWKKMN